jgi:hypothetical protein
MTMTALYPSLVYALCFLTSTACAVLLGRMYLRARSAMVFWSAACFVLLALTNFLLVVDLVFLPRETDLRPLRLGLSLVAVSLLLFGFIWKEED